MTANNVDKQSPSLKRDEGAGTTAADKTLETRKATTFCLLIDITEPNCQFNLVVNSLFVCQQNYFQIVSFGRVNSLNDQLILEF